MTFSQIKKLLTKALKELETEVILDSPDLTDDELKQVLEIAKNKILEQQGIDPQEYADYEESLKEIGKAKSAKKKEELKQAIIEAEERITSKIPSIPRTLTPEAIKSLVDDSISRLPKPTTTIINKIVKEVVREKPITNVIRTKEITKEIDKTELEEVKKDIFYLQEKFGEIKIPDYELLKKDLESYSADHISDLWGTMPDFRMLGMGLQGQIDELRTSLKGEAIWGSITGTLSSQLDLQTALDAKVPYVGATADVNIGAHNLILDGGLIHPAFGFLTVSPSGSLSDNSGNLSVDFTGRSLVNALGYGILEWNTDNIIIYSGGSFGALFDASLLLTDTRTFTFPDASGTLAYSVLGTYAGIDTYINQAVLTTSSPQFANLIITGGGDIKPSVDSTSAINIAQADGTDFVRFDSTNKNLRMVAGTITLDNNKQIYGTLTTGGAINILLLDNGNNLSVGGSSVAVAAFTGGTEAWLRAGTFAGVKVINTGSITSLGGTVKLQADNQKLLFGAGDDASIYYDGTNMVINPKEVGTGYLDILGNLDLDNTTYASQYGVITKNGTRFIHDFNYGDNGTVTTAGYNTFIGYNAGNFTMGSTATTVDHGSYNTAIGNEVLKANTTGYHNVGIGYWALYRNTSGYRNFALGSQSLEYNTTGDSNLAIGVLALALNTSGNNNVALGYRALYCNTTAYQNVGIGTYASYYNQTGNFNTAIGFYSDGFASGGPRSHGYQTTIGSYAGYNNTYGSNGVMIGHFAGGSNTTGNNVIYIGFKAGYRQTTASNLLIIDNQLRASTAEEATNAIIYGVMTAAPADQDLTLNANIFLTQVKLGASQVAAGAVANEIWKTSGHATLPDNVLMIGI